RPLAGAADPQGVVLVETELQVMGAEAGVDEGELLRLWLVHYELALVGVDRIDFGKGIVRALAAIRRRTGRVIGAGQPQPALGVEHVVMICDLRIPDLPHAPIGRRRDRLRLSGMSGA